MVTSTDQSDERSPEAEHEYKKDLETPASKLIYVMKFLAASALLMSAVNNFTYHSSVYTSTDAHNGNARNPSTSSQKRRRLMDILPDGSIPSYMEDLMQDLKERKKLMEETPPQEVKYWFEYTGPLQVRELISMWLFFSILDLFIQK